MDVEAPENDFLTGVVVDVNGLLTVTTSGIRQSNHAVVWYAITTPVANGDTVTWNYNDTTGLIVSESGGVPLGDVAQASVTNNVAADPGIALRADAVAYWKMDEASGTRTDATTRGNNLTPINVPSSVVGKIGNAVQFASVSQQYLTTTASADLFLGQRDLYIAGWYKITSKADTSYLIVKEREGAAAYNLHYDVTNDIFIFGSDFDLGFSAEGWSLNPVPLDTWIFIECFYNTSTNRIDIAFNGESFGVNWVPANVPPSDAAGTFYLGFVGSSTYADAAIDELGFWRRILTPTERTYLYNSGAGRALYP